MQENEAQGSAAAATTDLYDLGVVEAAEAIRNGEVTSERYTAALLQRARTQSDSNAFVTIDETAALEAARGGQPSRRRSEGSAARRAYRNHGQLPDEGATYDVRS